jgi:hypothetical protein
MKYRNLKHRKTEHATYCVHRSPSAIINFIKDVTIHPLQTTSLDYSSHVPTTVIF